MAPFAILAAVDRARRRLEAARCMRDITELKDALITAHAVAQDAQDMGRQEDIDTLAASFGAMRLIAKRSQERLWSASKVRSHAARFKSMSDGG